MRYFALLKSRALMITAVILMAGGVSACITPAVIATSLTIAGTAAKTSMDIATAVKDARGSISEKESIFDKLKEFRVQYCARPELRAESREALVSMMQDAGVPEVDADVKVSMAKKLGQRMCGGG